MNRIEEHFRFNLILIFILLFWGIIMGRLFYLQVKEHRFYQAQALGQQTEFVELVGRRGEIFFKRINENLSKKLAINRDAYLLYANPSEIKDKIKTSQSLSRVLNLSSDLILSKIKKKGFYTIIKKRLTEKEIEGLRKLSLPGIYLKRHLGRYYPQETLAAHIIGFLGGDGRGQYGLEGYYDEILRGKKSFRSKREGFFFLEKFGFFENGSNLYLNLDYRIQFKAESLLKEAKRLFDIESGEIIVLEPNTGKIFALANFPSFNPNHYYQEKDLSIFQNSAIQKIFEPGSVFKPITLAIALNEGKITPQTKYYDKGFVKAGEELIYNYEARVYGEQTMTQVLEKSINTGAVFAMRLIPKEIFLDYFNKFGFTEKTGVDLQGEIFSINQNLKKGREINFATASFGQGIEMTSLQLARAFAVIANGGKLFRPYLVEKIVKEREEIKIEPQLIRDEIINRQTASQITAMLVSVVENGFGKRAKVPGYYIAGKTGTAQVAIEGQKGYLPQKTIQSFIGYAPAFNPKFLILIKLENPKTKTAEYSAGPIFQKLAKYIINLWQIPPDYE